MTRTPDRRTPHLLGATVALASVLVLAACGSGSGATGTGVVTQAQADGQSAATGIGQGGVGSGRFGGGQAGRGFPGAFGLVADVTGNTAQLQSATSQTAVTWTRSTLFTAQVATTASHLRVGDCVSARPARPTAAGAPGSTVTGTPAPTATSDGSDATLAAATVEVFAAAKGTCTMTGLAGAQGLGGFGGFGTRIGGRPSATGGLPPTAPSAGGPQNGAGGFGGQVRGTVGRVNALGSGSFMVAPVVRRAPGGATPTAPSSGSASPVTVTYTATTTFTTLTRTAASAVKVGVCVSALGKADDTGAVTATAIQVSQPVGGSCPTGFRQAGSGRPSENATRRPNA